MRIAERDDGMVINADALQVYECWRVLTARPSAADAARVPHALYGHVAAAMRYSVGHWLDELSQTLQSAARADRRPIIIGGTGLYLSALTEGLVDIPPIDPKVRRMSQARIDAGALDDLIRDLAVSDPMTHSRIDLANPMRVQRAWEVLRSTGRGLAAWQNETPPAMLPRTECDCFVIHPSVPMQQAAVEARFRKMIAQGALDEVRAFRESGTSMTVPAARALGAAPLIRYLDGDLDLETAIDLSVTATRQFSKRQRSWFRGRMSAWIWLDPNVADFQDLIPPDKAWR